MSPRVQLLELFKPDSRFPVGAIQRLNPSLSILICLLQTRLSRLVLLYGLLVALVHRSKESLPSSIPFRKLIHLDSRYPVGPFQLLNPSLSILICLLQTRLSRLVLLHGFLVALVHRSKVSLPSSILFRKVIHSGLRLSVGPFQLLNPSLSILICLLQTRISRLVLLYGFLVDSVHRGKVILPSSILFRKLIHLGSRFPVGPFQLLNPSLSILICLLQTCLSRLVLL